MKLNEPQVEETEKQPTPEEIKEMAEKAKAFYLEQLELIRPQAEYEKILADMEEDRFRRLHFITQRAQLQSSMKPKEEGKTSGKRDLKKD